MAIAPIPVIFETIYQARPWGGRRLGDLFGKKLPAHPAIGESWEVVSLPGHESRVRDGPLAGCTISELVELWGRGLIGGAELVEGRFPLLIKFLDARQALSVQVHPKPGDDPTGKPAAGVKHEAWYVIEAEPQSELLIGFQEGVRPEQVAAAARTREIVALLRRWPARAGQCFYLPSGVPHVLGAGLVVAEIQTPSDVTYRLYDWDRVDERGRARELHIEQALAHARYDVRPQDILQPRSHVAGVYTLVTRLAACERFLVDKVRLAGGVAQGIPHAEMVVWVVLAGRGELRRDPHLCRFAAGDVVVIPADSASVVVEPYDDCELLEVKVPVPSPLAGWPRPPADRRERGDLPTGLTLGGRPLRPPQPAPDQT
jgi:mannose-6-phosphate isomerase